MQNAPIPVYLEVGKKRTFACAVEWPGWCRSGRDEAAALSALVAHAPRYAAALGGVASFVVPRSTDELRVVERLTGGPTTDFGAPEMVGGTDERPMDVDELERQLAILDAAWSALDRAAEAAGDRPLRTGPRGGGRSVPKMIDHVRGAERAYLSRLGSRSPSDVHVGALRDLIRQVVRSVVAGEPIEHPSRTASTWPPRYFIRRAAWHVLDHAWEIEDRAGA
jgi:hypothetical protein